jgi:hypothetical protein
MYKIYNPDGSEIETDALDDISFREETDRLTRQMEDLNNQRLALRTLYGKLSTKTMLPFSLAETKDVTEAFVEKLKERFAGQTVVSVKTIKTNGWIIYSNRCDRWKDAWNDFNEIDLTQMVSNLQGAVWSALKIELSEDKTSVEIIPNDQGYQLVAFMELRDTKKVMRDSRDIQGHETNIYAVYKVESDYRVQRANYTGRNRSLPIEDQIRILLEGRVLYQPNLPDITEKLRKYGMKRKLKGK